MNPVGGRNFIYPRFYRHSFIIAIDDPETSTLIRIFSAITEWHFSKGFNDKVAVLGKVMHYLKSPTIFALSKLLSLQNVAAAVCEIYKQISETFRPVPQKPHYLFSIRDVASVIQGILMVPPKKLTTPEKLTRLWAHENYRVFSDK